MSAYSANEGYNVGGKASRAGGYADGGTDFGAGERRYSYLAACTQERPAQAGSWSYFNERWDGRRPVMHLARRHSLTRPASSPRSIRNRLTALKKDRTEYIRAKDVLAIYGSLMREGASVSSPLPAKTR